MKRRGKNFDMIDMIWDGEEFFNAETGRDERDIFWSSSGRLIGMDRIFGTERERFISAKTTSQMVDAEPLMEMTA